MLKQEQINQLIGQPFKLLYRENKKYPSVYSLVFDKHGMFLIKSIMEDLPECETKIKQIIVKMIEKGMIKDIESTKNITTFLIISKFQGKKYALTIKLGGLNWVFTQIEDKGFIRQEKVETSSFPSRDSITKDTNYLRKFGLPTMATLLITASAFVISNVDFSFKYNDKHQALANETGTEEIVNKVEKTTKVEEKSITEEIEKQSDDSLVKTNLLENETEEQEVTVEAIKEVLKEEGYVIVKEDELTELQRMASEYQNLQEEVNKLNDIKSAVQELLTDNVGTSTNDAQQVVNKNVEVQIPFGMKSQDVSKILVEKGLIKNKEEAMQVFTDLKAHTKIQSGVYQFTSETPLVDIIKTITHTK